LSRKVLPQTVVCFLLAAWASAALAGSEIPKAAWTRPIGLPLETPGVTKDASGIDDGYWQGAPVGGMGSGTFSRTYRGDFSRWHIKAGVHKYETVYADEFAMFQKSEGDSAGTARVLMTDHPKNGELASWAWDYPVGAGNTPPYIQNPGTTISGTSFPLMWCWNSSLPCSPTLSRVKLPGSGLPLARGESDRPCGHSLGATFLGEHGGVVSDLYA